MQIYIDESGTFVPSASAGTSVSVVGALIVPRHQHARLLKKYAKLMLQSKSLNQPIIHLIGADYSHFQSKYEIETPDHLRQHGFSEGSGISLNKLLKEDFRFSSEPEPGLELVDIVTNALRRCLNGRLKFSGWSGIPALMIHRKGPYVPVLTLNTSERPINAPYLNTLVTHFTDGGRSMLTKSNYDEGSEE